MKLSKLLGAAALGAFVLASASASALTLRITDLGLDGALGGGDDTSVTINDQDPLVMGVGDSSLLAGTINFAGTVGGFTLATTATTALDANSISRLALSETTVTGTGFLLIESTETGFGEGAFAPTPSNLTFTANAAQVGNEIAFSAFAADDNAAFNTSDITIASGTVTNVTDDVIGSVGAPLTDPFSMTVTALLDHSNGGIKGVSSGFDSIAIATVPVPAPFALLIAALAGLGFVGRRRTAAA